MAHLIWTDDLSIGIEVIDKQHMRIVSYINELNDAIHMPHTKEAHRRVLSVLNSAIEYTESHFAFEESMLEDVNYEFLRPHKKVHELFVRKMQKYRERIEGGEDIALELHNTLKLWLIHHIKNEDKDYREWILKHNSEKKIEEEKIRERFKKEKKGWFSRLFSGK